MRLSPCHNFHDFRTLAKRRLLGPIFNGTENLLPRGVKALSMWAKAIGLGRAYLFPLAAAGQQWADRILGLMKDEVDHDMRLMRIARVADLSRDNLRFRQTALGAK